MEPNTLLIRSKWFRTESTDRLTQSENNAVGSSSPLQQCLQWIAAATKSDSSRCFVALAHEVLRSDGHGAYREYEAIDSVALRRWVERPVPWGERVAHEVICGAVKLYVDVDVDCRLNRDMDFEWHVTTFVDALVARATKLFAVRCSTLLLDASRCGVKHSRHIIVSMRTAAGVDAYFKSAQHCSAFVRAVARELDFDHCTVIDDDGTRSSLSDYSVYRSNGTLRLYGSSKATDNRPLRRMSSVESADGRLDYETFMAALVSPPNAAHGHLLTMPGIAVSDAPQRQAKRAHTVDRMRRFSVAQISSLAVDAIRQIEVVVQAGIIGIRQLDETLFRVDCRSHWCAQRGSGGGNHRHSCIHYMVDLQRKRYQQRCYPCSRRGMWTWFSSSTGEQQTQLAPPLPPNYPKPLMKCIPSVKRIKKNA